MRLFVGGINYQATEKDLEEFFTTGDIKVVEAVIIQDRTSGQPRSKGFGFITLETDRKQKDVIADFHMRKLMGKPLTVNEAKPLDKPRGGGYSAHGRA